ncbi:MAG TPA: DUF1684 domain-containing protein [Actinomycetota bacterium]|nr:DUF1684 domain-containing protein [Actinomycetota bacterium]
MTRVHLLDLLDWKRRIFGSYAGIRAAPDPEPAWKSWRAGRDELFATHPQTPLPEEARPTFKGLPFFDYDPRARVLADVAPAEPEHYDIATSGEEGGSYEFTRFAVARFELSGKPLELELYWLDGYGGGLFLSFRDGTSGSETYGAGRYLLDTVKGADLGMEGERLVLDFNFAYNPSCAYDPRWVCPLVPPPNRLAVQIRAGERYP